VRVEMIVGLKVARRSCGCQKGGVQFVRVRCCYQNKFYKEIIFFSNSSK
jgi:hypothetical protein